MNIRQLFCIAGQAARRRECARDMRSFLLTQLLATMALPLTAAVPTSPDGSSPSALGWVEPRIRQVLPGVWQVRFGTPERFTPTG